MGEVNATSLNQVTVTPAAPPDTVELSAVRLNVAVVPPGASLHSVAEAGIALGI